MTGHEMYTVWAEANELEGVSIDKWEDLDDCDVDVWVRFAELLGERALDL